MEKAEKWNSKRSAGSIEAVEVSTKGKRHGNDQGRKPVSPRSAATHH